MAIFETDGPFGFPPFSRYLLNFILLLVGINLFINFPLSRLIEHLRGRDFYWGFLLSGGFLMLSSLIYQMLPALPRLFKYISSLVGFAFLVYWLIFILTQRFARQA